MWIWILIGLAVILVLMTIYYYNQIVVLANRINNAFSQIDVQLKRRNDLVPNLVSTVKGYASHEKAVFSDVTKARTLMMNAKSVDDKASANNMITDALKSVFALAENYPDLKSNQNFIHLQQELSDIESKIAYTRQFYNDSVLVYNNQIQSFPGVLFAKLFSAHEKVYLKTSEEERKNVKVEF